MKELAASLFIICMTPCLVFGASSDPRDVSTSNVYVSDADRLLTIHKIAILPATDNVSGLYGRYEENKLGDLLKNAHRFDLSSVKDLDPRKTLEDYETDPNLVKKIGAQNHVDALIGGHVNKLKNGVEITLDLFLTGDGELFLPKTPPPRTTALA